MQIKQEHFIDKGEQDDKGFYDYYYEGDIYEIIFDTIIYKARSYTHTPNEVSFLSRIIAGKNLRFHNIPYEEETFLTCIRYFKDKLGFKDFKVLVSKTRAYETIQLQKIANK